MTIILRPLLVFGDRPVEGETIKSHGIYLLIFTLAQIWGTHLGLASPNADGAFREASEIWRKGDPEGAYAFLKKVDHQTWSEPEIGLKLFGLSVLAQEVGLWLQSEDLLKRSQQLDSSKAAYISYLLGHSYKETGRWELALKQFKETLRLKPPKLINFQTRFELSGIYLQQKKWGQAYKHLKPLERRWRGTSQYPELLWRLIKLERDRKREWRSCRWARKIYSRYPSHPLVYDWGINLSKARFEGKPLGCTASFSDQKSRLRRLQWAGESPRARQELEALRKSSGKQDKLEVDQLLAHFLVNEGFVDEAIKTLLPHYQAQKKNFSYLMLLGKAASRAGEFPTAVGAYYRAFQSNPRSRAGRKALYRAAFLSYQFQDYDGASRKFQEFVRRYPRSGLSRDAAWHMAWIQYLKKDYSGALKGFKYVLNQKKKRKRGWRKYSEERLRYWVAMTYYRQEKFNKARPLFEQLMSNRLIDFYSVAAQYRYNSMPGVEPVEKLVTFDRKLASIKEDLVKIEEVPATNSQPEERGGPKKAGTDPEDEGEELLQAAEEEDEAEVDEEGEAQVAEAGTDPGSGGVAEFSNPKLQERFDRAHGFIKLGLFTWARWELYGIERSTRNPSHLKQLIKAYEGIHSYHRSSYIGEWNFAQERKKGGMVGAKPLWEAAYPRAYHTHVEKYSSAFGVPDEFIWGIMRAESRYRPDVVSPVGAKGLMQIMPFTGRQVAKLLGDPTFHERQLSDPEVNIRLGTRYLHRLLKKFDRQIPLAAAGYNAGPHRVEAWLANFGTLDMDEFIEHIPFIETRNYVKKVVRYYAIYKNLRGNDALDMSWLSRPVPIKISARPSPRESWESID